MKEHEKSFCRAKSTFDPLKKPHEIETEDHDSSPIDSDEKDSNQLMLPQPEVHKSIGNSSSSSGNSSEGSGSKTPSPEHPSQIADKLPDASDFSVKAVVAQ